MESPIRKMYKEHLSHMAYEPVSKEPSLTVPDEALSIREILLNFTRGTLPPIQKQPQYADDEYNDYIMENDSELDDITNDPTYLDDVQRHHDAVLAAEVLSQREKAKKNKKEEPKDPPVDPPEPPKED